MQFGIHEYNYETLLKGYVLELHLSLHQHTSATSFDTKPAELLSKLATLSNDLETVVSSPSVSESLPLGPLVALATFSRALTT